MSAGGPADIHWRTIITMLKEISLGPLVVRAADIRVDVRHAV
jgi:hypothetical protein